MSICEQDDHHSMASRESEYLGRPSVTPLDHDGEFLLSCIRDESSARLKLLRILGNASSIRPMLQIADLLERYDAPLPDSVIGETVVYLANAWSKQGVGLFDRANSRNVAIAADLAIAQTSCRTSAILRSVRRCTIR
jgi:hypothetical protein